MRVTYIGHSGFLVEWEDTACLFDCCSESVPTLDRGKRLFVFASHAHSDHFSPTVFELGREQPQRMFFLSSDISAAPPSGDEAAVIRMAPHRKRVVSGGKLGALTVSTLGSTDAGAAFLVTYGGQTVFHAGDLHWWAWPDDTPEEAADMKSRFFAELLKLKGVNIHAAFLPLDPRLGGNFWLGFDAVLRTVQVDAAFPMHMWGRYEYIKKLRQMTVSAPYRDRIMNVRVPGQIFEI